MARSGSSATATVVSSYSSGCWMFVSLVACCLLLMPQLSSPAPMPQNQQGGRGGEAVTTGNEPPGGQIHEIVTATNDTSTSQFSNITDGAFIGENQGAQEKQPVSKITTASAPVVSSGSSSIISNKKMYSAALPQTMLASNSTPVSFITLNRNNRPSFLVFGSSLSSSSTVRPTSAYMINPDLITIQSNESEHLTEHQTAVDASSSVSKPAAVIISLQSNESDSSLIIGAIDNSTRLAVIDPYASQSALNGEANSTISSSLTPSVDKMIVVSSSSTTTPVSIALKNDQATSQSPASKTTTTTTTTTIRPNPPPNVGVFNGLSKIGSASIGLGITSAAYAAAALWIPFIGRRKKRSPPSLDVVWKNYDGLNYANDWFINNDYH